MGEVKAVTASVTFEFNGKTYKGDLTSVKGQGFAERHNWELTINGRLRGHLMYHDQRREWVFVDKDFRVVPDWEEVFLPFVLPYQ